MVTTLFFKFFIQEDSSSSVVSAKRLYDYLFNCDSSPELCILHYSEKLHGVNNVIFFKKELHMTSDFLKILKNYKNSKIMKIRTRLF